MNHEEVKRRKELKKKEANKISGSKAMMYFRLFIDATVLIILSTSIYAFYNLYNVIKG